MKAEVFMGLGTGIAVASILTAGTVGYAVNEAREGISGADCTTMDDRVNGMTIESAYTDDSVVVIQQALIDSGVIKSLLNGADGNFGGISCTGLDIFQEENGLVNDLRLGPQTAKALGIDLGSLIVKSNLVASDNPAEPTENIGVCDSEYTVVSGDSWFGIARKHNSSTAELMSINGAQGNTPIYPGQKVCLSTDNDQTAPAQPSPNTAPTGVLAQQQKSNELLSGYGYEHVAEDNILGPQTAQAQCAVEFLQGSEDDRDGIVAGSVEEQDFMTKSVKIPSKVEGVTGPWGVLNETCQVGVFGNNDIIQFVFGISTGGAGYGTRNGSTLVFRYNPALDRGGWHDSTDYPSLDGYGNMYKPIYFNRGQAIHGSNNVPPYPKSKGCARLKLSHQDRLINEWLGWGSISKETFYNSLPNRPTVVVTGDYIS